MFKEQEVAIRAAKRAGEIILAHFQKLRSEDIDEKAAFDYVTIVDRACEKTIREELSYTFPNDCIIGEEEGGKFIEGKRSWIIDPLDGTLNFIHGFPLFSVSIGLVSEMREPLVGVVFVPVLGELFTAIKGQGAYLNQQKIQVSSATNPKHFLFATGFPNKSEDSLSKGIMLLKNVIQNCAGVRMPGSAAIHLAYTACGKLNGFWEQNLKSWDVAAGVLLVEEAGGKVTDFHKQKDFLTNGEIISGNASAHEWLFKIIASHLR